jgi:hypothetical protein
MASTIDFKEFEATYPFSFGARLNTIKSTWVPLRCMPVLLLHLVLNLDAYFSWMDVCE